MEPVRGPTTPSVPEQATRAKAIADWIERSVEEVKRAANEPKKTIKLQTIAEHPKGLSAKDIIHLIGKLSEQLKDVKNKAAVDALLEEVIERLEGATWVSELDLKSIRTVHHKRAELQLLKLYLKAHPERIYEIVKKLPEPEKAELLIEQANIDPYLCLDVTLETSLPKQYKYLIAKELDAKIPRILPLFLTMLGIKKGEQKEFHKVTFDSITIEELFPEAHPLREQFTDRLTKIASTCLTPEEIDHVLSPVFRGADISSLLRVLMRDSKSHIHYLEIMAEKNPNGVINYLIDDTKGEIDPDTRERLLTLCLKARSPPVLLEKSLEDVDLSQEVLNRLAIVAMDANPEYFMNTIQCFHLTDDSKKQWALKKLNLEFDDYLVFIAKLKLSDNDYLEMISKKLNGTSRNITSKTINLARDLPTHDKSINFAVACLLAQQSNAWHFLLSNIHEFSPHKGQLLEIARHQSQHLQFIIPHLQLFDFETEDDRFMLAFNLLKSSDAGSEFTKSGRTLDFFRLSDKKKEELLEKLYEWNPQFVCININEFTKDATIKQGIVDRAQATAFGRRALAMGVQNFDLTEEQRFTLAKRQEDLWLARHLDSFKLSREHKQEIIEKLLPTYAVIVTENNDFLDLDEDFQLKIIDALIFSGLNEGDKFHLSEDRLMEACKKFAKQNHQQLRVFFSRTPMSDAFKEKMFAECVKINRALIDHWRSFDFVTPPTVEYATNRSSPVDQIFTEPSKFFRLQVEKSLAVHIANPSNQPQLNLLLDAMENIRDTSLLQSFQILLEENRVLGESLTHLKGVSERFILFHFLLKQKPDFEKFLAFIQGSEFKEFFNDSVKATKLVRLLTKLCSPFSIRSDIDALTNLQTFIENSKDKNKVKLLERLSVDLRVLFMFRSLHLFNASDPPQDPRDFLWKPFLELIPLKPDEVEKLSKLPRDFGLYSIMYAAGLSTMYGPNRSNSLNSFTTFLKSALNGTFKEMHFSEVDDLQGQKVFSLLKDKTPWMTATKETLVTNTPSTLTQQTLIETLKKNPLPAYPRVNKALENPELVDELLKELDIEEKYEEYLLKLIKFEEPIKVLEFLQMRTPKKNPFRKTLDQLLDEGRPKGSKQKLSIGLSTNPIDYLLCGTEVPASCQAVTGFTSFNIGLLGYLMNATTTLLVVNNEKGQIVARCVLRLYTGEGADENKVYLLQETMYSTVKDDALLRALKDKAAKLAKELGVEHVLSNNHKGTVGLKSWGGKKGEYSDAAAGVKEGPYTCLARPA